MFLVEFIDFPQLEAARVELQKLGDEVGISFLDIKGVGGM